MNINISTLLDVAIGLIFIFFVFSMFVSGIVELINSFVDKRAEFLERALGKILGKLTVNFYEHQLIKVKEDGLTRKSDDTNVQKNKFTKSEKDGSGVSKKPVNYLSADSFSTVVIDLLTKGVVALSNPGENPTKQVFEKIQQAALTQEDEIVKELIRPMLAKSDDLKTFKAELEKWYNGYMEQVSGWFKLYAQRVVRIVALLMSIVLNVDTIYITNRLFNDNGLRDRVVSQAILTTKNGSETFAKDTKFGEYLRTNDAALVKSYSTNPNTFVVRPNLTGLDSIAVQSAYLRFVQDNIAELNLPIGWVSGGGKSPFQPGQSWCLAILGWVLTAAALSFGAPFWFDLLLKLVNIRNTARRPPGNPIPSN